MCLREMTNKEDDLKNIFECYYLLLLIDQHDGGLWGKSIPIKKQELYASSEEAQSSKIQRRVESITVTFFAVDAIYIFTKNPKNPAIERALNCLPNHKDNGGYGSFGELISAYPTHKHQIMTSCRHTATALLTYLLFQDEIDENIVESFKFLIDHSNKDGGWGITADPEKEDSECLSTAHIVRLLTTVKKMGIMDFLPENYLSKLDKSIMSGLNWLERNNKECGGLWFFDERMKVHNSAAILAIFSDLKDYRKELYKKTLNRIASIQGYDGGWPLSLEGRSELDSTIWVVNALVNSKEDKYKSQIERGMDFIMSNISKWQYTKSLIAADWAMLLKLADYKNIYIPHELDDKIQNLANRINNEAFKSSNINFVRKKLPTQFHILKEPILGILENYLPDIVHRNVIEKLLDRTPRWKRWLITTTVTLLGLILGILSLI